MPWKLRGLVRSIVVFGVSMIVGMYLSNVI